MLYPNKDQSIEIDSEELFRRLIVNAISELEQLSITPNHIVDLNDTTPIKWEEGKGWVRVYKNKWHKFRNWLSLKLFGKCVIK